MTNTGLDWCYMLKLGTNMWCDCVPPRWGNLKPDEMHYKAPSDTLRCDDSLWIELTIALAGRLGACDRIGRTVCNGRWRQLPRRSLRIMV